MSKKNTLQILGKFYPMPSDSHSNSHMQNNLSQSSNQVQTLPISVITTCYGRNRHLYNLLTSLGAGSVKPAEVIIVNDDAEEDKLNKFDLNIVKIETFKQQNAERLDVIDDQKPNTGFDIGRNRNLGARKASHEMLIFLDVDCIASYQFVEGLATKLTDYSEALLMAQPCYLTRPLTVAESAKLQQLHNDSDWLQALAILNPYRHNMISNEHATISDDIKQTEDYGAFWSLCFAITKSQFQRIGGFDTHYVGYGAEDTDFAFTARKLGIPLYLTSDVAYHQQHEVYRPPLNHLSSIVINANRFYHKWQHWAMGGWLEAFATMGLIEWESQQTKPITIIRQPTDAEIKAAHHPDAAFV